jgi:hypothetical protein
MRLDFLWPAFPWRAFSMAFILQITSVNERNISTRILGMCAYELILLQYMIYAGASLKHMVVSLTLSPQGKLSQDAVKRGLEEFANFHGNSSIGTK